jgi:SAP domain
MTSTTEQYTAAANQAGSVVEKIADFWTQGAQAFTNQSYQSPALPQADLIPAVERYFTFVQRTIDMNREFTIKWVEAASTLSGVIREQAESFGELLSESATSARDLVHEQVDTAEQAAREQAEKAEQAEKELARQARKAERDQARQAHEKARERYEGLTKAELSDLLDKRDLPKTGTSDELIERLVEADSK